MVLLITTYFLYRLTFLADSGNLFCVLSKQLSREGMGSYIVDFAYRAEGKNAPRTIQTCYQNLLINL